MWLDGALAVRIDVAGELHGVVSLVIDDGRITHIYGVNNPDKLGRLDEPIAVSR